MMKRTLSHPGALVLALLLALGTSLPAQNVQHVPLTANVVAKALTGLGLQVGSDQVETPASLSSVGEPDLMISGEELLPNGKLLVRLLCKQTTCQPFMVTVRSEWLSSVSPRQKEQLGATSGRPASATERLVAGQRATLRLEGKHMLITLPILVIDSGAVGAEIRVSSLDHKRVFQAFVISSTGVRGELP